MTIVISVCVSVTVCLVLLIRANFQKIKIESKYLTVNAEKVLAAADDASVGRDGSRVSEQMRNEIVADVRRADTSRRPFQILWVDDHPEGNARERHALLMAGATVYDALSNRMAEDLRSVRQFDLVITDIGRDDEVTNGFDLIRDLALIEPTLDVVIFTSNRNRIDRTTLPKTVVEIEDSSAGLVTTVLDRMAGATRALPWR
ncbi:hypothetical protein [Gordonia sp. NPDC003376]